MSNWQEKPISDLGKIVTGKTPPKSEPDYWDGDELFVSPKDMERDSFYIKNTQANITKKALSKFKSQRLPMHSVMYTSLSYGFGKIGIALKEVLTNQQITSVIANKDNDYRFVYYLLRISTPHIFAYNSGIDTPIVPKSVFEKIKLPVPILPIQKKIAAILSAYDELIENNNRRIAILEKMAEEIYREWFVRMRFPGHEKVKVVKGVPEGWDIKKIGDAYKTSSGGTPYRSDKNNYGGNINWLKTGELKSTYIFESEEKITQKGLESSSAKLFPSGTVVMAMYCAMEDISILAVDAATNQACCGFFPKVDFLSSFFTYYQIKFALPHMIAFAHGAAQQNLSQDLIKGYNVFLPTSDLISKYSVIVEPIHNEIKYIIKAITRLKQSRDMLLPRLISGKLDVEKLDIAFPPGMSNTDPTEGKEAYGA